MQQQPAQPKGLPSNLVHLISPRFPFFWLLLLLLGFGWLIPAPRSEVQLVVHVEGDKITGQVNGASLPLDPTAPVSSTGTATLYVAPPETSQYYQAGEPDGPL